MCKSSLSIAQAKASGLVDMVFNVDERPTGQASMGAGYSDRDKMVGQLGLQIPNFRGMGQSLDFNWEFGTRREQFLVGFTEPWLFDTPTSLSARAYTQNIQYYDYRRADYRLNNSNSILWKSKSQVDQCARGPAVEETGQFQPFVGLSPL